MKDRRKVILDPGEVGSLDGVDKIALFRRRWRALNRRKVRGGLPATVPQDFAGFTNQRPQLRICEARINDSRCKGSATLTLEGQQSRSRRLRVGTDAPTFFDLVSQLHKMAASTRA